MIIVALTMSAVEITVSAGLALSGAVTNRVAKSERDQENKYIVDGAIQLATADLATGAEVDCIEIQGEHFLGLRATGCFRQAAGPSGRKLAPAPARRCPRRRTAGLRVPTA